MSTDGGPAFPVQNMGEWQAFGLTKREYYKAAALTGLLANEREHQNCQSTSAETGIPWRVLWVERAAEIADAMLAEDAEHEKEKP